MADAICSKVIDAQAMMDYMFRNSENSKAMEAVLEIYKRHISESLDKQFCGLSGVAPASVGDQFQRLKDDVIDNVLEILPKHTTEIERYIDQTMKVRETLSYRLAHIPPDEFEDIIHPIFQQDEWILLFVGGFLGVVIGLLQAWAMTHL